MDPRELSPLTAAQTARIHANVHQVRQRIAQAALAAHRNPDEIRLVAVTKYVPASWHAALASAGCLDWGESRPQSLSDKAPQLASFQPRWHFVGHWQRNKIRKTLPHVALLHSLDRLSLADDLEREAQAADRSLDALLEVNISGDANKGGFTPEEAAAAVHKIAAMSRVRLVGFMGMAGLTAKGDAARAQFAKLRELRDAIQAASGLRLPELSMGMSDDFPEAVREGATVVRVGSALFEGVME